MNKLVQKPFNRFLIIWFGQFISNIGSGLTAFSLGVHAFEKTQSAAVFSLIILFAFLPSYLLKPLGGTLSDRTDRRLLIIIGDTGSALALVFILLMFFAGFQEMWVIYLGVAASSVFVAFQNPAYKASVTDLIDEKRYSKASGLIQLSESSRFLISPIIAGFFMHFMNINQILMIDIFSFLVAVLSVLVVKKKIKIHVNENQKEDFFSDFKTGFKYTFSNKSLLCLLSITSIVTFAVGFFQALMGPMILAFTNAKTLGIVQTLSASGMIVSSLMIGIFSKSKNRITILAVSLIFTGIFYTLFGTSTHIVFLICTGFLFFITLPFVNTSLEVLIRKNVDNKMQGRVWSIVSLISQLGMLVAFSTAGFLADKVFNPMLLEDSCLATNVGEIIGVGQGRGIGFMFVLSGFLIVIIASVLIRNKTIKTWYN